MDFQQLLTTESYDFLRTDKCLGANIILLGLGGSYAYGTNVEGSDVDIRGCALNSKMEILTNRDFEQVVHEETDTTIYSFRKLVSLLAEANPNAMEIIGLKPEQYLYLSPIGQSLLDHTHLFLSKKAAYSFGEYASKQLWRLSANDMTKLGKRNRRALEHGKLGKHMMHLIRLYYMCFDILEQEKIVTFREKEHSLLMDLRAGKYLDGEERPIPEFYEMLEELDRRLKDDKENTSLPEHPDYEAIYEYIAFVNEKKVKDEV